MPTDLNILKKAFQNATATYESVSPGNEPITRRESVQAEQVLGAPALPNDVGGWVASGGFPYQSTEYLASSVTTYPIQTGAMPPARGYSETNPGAAGYPDVDFVPYNWGTNRFGNKGGALLGHPISWEVVGPTAKSPYLHWQWAVDGTLNTISLEPGVLTNTLTGGALVPTVEDGYNLSAGGIGDYNGGLYVLVTLTGGEADATGAGALLGPASPLTPTNPGTSSFEVFRVASYLNQKITLESSKLLSSYFAVGADPKIRAITLIRPKVTRLAAFPLSVLGAQRNQVYVFLPPETAARSELLPPYEGGGGSCPDWSVNGIGGDVSDGSYGGDAPLPVPLPLYRLDGYIAVAGTFLNQMQVYVTLGAGQSITQGQIVRVTSHARDAVLDGKESHVFGYFEATNTLAASGTSILRRVPEVNPATGEVFYGPGPSGGTKDFVSVEVYDTISTVFTDPVLNVAKVAATRLDHLIDPRNAPYTFQRFSGTDSPVGTTTPPGASIFDTVTGSPNPGNLTELGFRVVLFPAKDGSGNAVPDFDNPITSERVVLAPLLPAATVQTIEIDYSAGVLYLSHQPVPGAGCTVATGIYGTGGNNPRGEIVLFASCVPYSREETQRGGGIRVKATRPVSDLNPFGEHDAFDVYGKRCIAIPTTPGSFVSGTDLAVTFPTSELPPETGWFYFAEVTAGTISSVSAPNYYPYFNGSSPLSTVSVGTPGGYTITSDTVVVFIKGPWNQIPASDYWHAGTTRGGSKRADAVNFKGANVSLEADGSVTVQTVATLDEAYRAGDPATPGAGRVITVDGAAVEAQPDAADNNDTFRSSFRVSVADVSGAKSLTGFDFKSDASTAALADPYAGFSDRRVFAPTSATSTTLTPSFTVNVILATVTATAGEFFWFAGSYDSTLLIFGHDLIEIEGVTYIISGYGADEYKVLIRNLDGTTPVLALTGVQATVYRPRLLTGRGSTGTPADNYNTWITAQEQSEAVSGQPFGALNLYAGSSTAIGAGDGGGSTAALAFWSRVATSGFASYEALFSTMYFDTMGRMISTLNPDFMQGGNLPDYKYRGDFATRAVKDTIFPTAPAFGHIVEEYSDVEARYDYLSLVPLIFGGATYNATATNVLTGQVTVTSVLLADLIPYGSAIFELTSVNGDPAKRGLFLITSGDGISVSPNTYFWLRDLNGTVGTLALAPLLVVNTNTLTFRLHFSTSIGKRKDTLYLDTALAAVSHTASQSLGVGLETNAVGLSISAPIRYVGALNEDRHAYRVTTASTPGSGVSPSNIETAALDVEGYHKAYDYLYLASRTITKQINPQLFQPINTLGTQWDFDDVNGWWDSNGDSYIIKIPLDLPRSSDRTDSAGAMTHRTRLTSITVKGQFHGGASNEAIVRIYRVTLTGLPPTRTQLYLGPAVAVQNYLLPSAGADTTTLIAVWEDAAATLPVYIDDTASTYYYIEVVSASSGGSSDLLYGVSVTYTDPGPRNY